MRKTKDNPMNNIVLLLSGWIILTQAVTGQVIYVDDDAAGANDGTSWANAYNYLQDALADADASPKPVEIWVATGTYYPTSDYGLGIGDRGKHFRMINEVALFGGFPSGGGIWESRDPDTYETILSGDIGTLNDPNDNCYHVFYHPANTLHVDNTAVLDGFTITAGNADGSDYSFTHSYGGGMFNDRSSPTVSNSTFRYNSAQNGAGICNLEGGNPKVIHCVFETNTAENGGGFFNRTVSNPIISNCIFIENLADVGGGIYNWNSSPTITNCTFSRNSAYDSGGIGNYYSNPMVTNCTFSGNSVNWGGGVINYRSDTMLDNCTFIGNSAYHGAGIINLDCYPTVSNSTFHMNSAQDGGAGMSNLGANPTVINCIFNNNFAGYYGGGMFNTQSSAEIMNCKFNKNFAQDAGGMRNDRSNLTIINCIFNGNRADGYGGGLTNYDSSCTIVNCTFKDNSAVDAGGAMNNYWKCNIKLKNCIFWDNHAQNGPNFDLNEDSSAVLKWNNIQDGMQSIYINDNESTVNWGEGNIDEVPLLTPDGHLRSH